LGVVERHLLLSGALFQTNVTNARESVNTTVNKQTVPIVSAGAALSDPRHRSRSCRQDHGQMERVRRHRADEVAGDEVAGSLGRPCIVPDKRRPAAGQHCQPVVQPAQQISNRRPVGGWRTGGLSFRDVRRHLACRKPGHVRCPSFWRFDSFAEAKIDKNWTAKLFVNNIFNKLYYTAFLSKCGAVHSGSTRPDRGDSAFSEVLIVDAMLICIPDVLSKAMWRIFAASWTNVHGKTDVRPPAPNRRWSRATSSYHRTARYRAQTRQPRDLGVDGQSAVHLGGGAAADISRRCSTVTTPRTTTVSASTSTMR